MTEMGKNCGAQQKYLNNWDAGMAQMDPLMAKEIEGME